MIHLTAIGQIFHKRLVSGLFDALRDLLHGPFEGFHFPMIAIGCTIEYLLQTARINGILESGRPLGAQSPMVNGTIGIAFDVDDTTILDIDVQATAYRAVRADALYYFRIPSAGGFRPALIAERLYSGAYLHDLGDGSLNRFRQKRVILHSPLLSMLQIHAWWVSERLTKQRRLIAP